MYHHSMMHCFWVSQQRHLCDWGWSKSSEHQKRCFKCGPALLIQQHPSCNFLCSSSCPLDLKGKKEMGQNRRQEGDELGRSSLPHT